MNYTELRHVLLNSTLKERLLHCLCFSELNDMSKEGVAVVLGQWWHPLHYFPSFLSRTLSVVPMIEMKTAISKILFQELGEGDCYKAHENVYIQTMVDAGFCREKIINTPPLGPTRELVEGYAKASNSCWSGLGFMYGTETADLSMVSSIGKWVRQVTGKQQLAWVDIHVKQEPDHVRQANQAIEHDFHKSEVEEIVANAENVWRLWIDFFSRLS